MLRWYDVTFYFQPSVKLHSNLMFRSSEGIFSSAQTFIATPPSDSDLFDKYEHRTKISLVPAKGSE